MGNRKKHEDLTPEQINEFQDRYNEGESVNSIAMDTGIASWRIYRVIDTAPRHERQQLKRAPRFHNDALKFSEETRAEAVRLYRDETLNAKEVAALLNATGTLPLEMTALHVSRILEMARVPTHPLAVAQHNKRVPIPGIDKEYRDEHMSMTALAKRHHKHPSTIRRMLEDLGVEIRKPGTQYRTPNP